MDFKNIIGLGVAGNFTGHLEQAGESGDFVNVVCDDDCAPKGIFPFYIPNDASFLCIYPISTYEINLPQNGELQAEPECAIVCDVEYKNGKVSKLIPKYFGAFNDCSIRKEGAKKISEKKNWGVNSKGLAKNLINIDEFSPNGLINDYHIISFLKRDGALYKYGIDSPINGYNYFYDKLLNWIITKLNEQKDEGPLEDISKLIKSHQALISVGATRYTVFGENDRLKLNDEIFVVLYPSTKYNKDEIKEMITQNIATSNDVSFLRQTVTRQ